MVVINNPFRRSSATVPKWRHRSTTMQLKLDDDDDDGYHQESSSNNPYFRNENSKAPQSSAPPVAPYKSSGSNSTNSSTIYRTKQKPKYDDNATLTTAKAVAPNLTDGNLVNSDSHLNGIGDYIFLSRLGDGKFSQVMLAEHHSTGEKVAVKIINKRAHQYRVMYRLVREIQLMEVLNEHSNIVTLYETYETADALYLVMEYVPGLNLEDYLKSIATNNNSDKNKFAHLDEEKARHIFRQIVKAVDYCHSRWVVHRDLKTPNILLTGENLNQVKIADFGLGNRYGLQRLKTVCGSMLYYSPEIIAARSYIGPEVDTWCLGILLFRMTAGTELFAHAKTPAELKKYILCRQYRFPSHLSTDLQLTIQKCLSTDRANRLSLETILKQDPWFTNNGTLSNEDIFFYTSNNGLSVTDTNNTDDSRLNYNAKEATRLYAESFRSEDLNRVQMGAQQTKRQCKQDLLQEQEKRRQPQQQYPDTQQHRKTLFPCKKTVIYHITHSSTYFTSSDASIQSGDKEQTQIITELNQQLLVNLKSVHLRSMDEKEITSKSTISRVFRKSKLKEQQQTPSLKLRKAASVLSLLNQKGIKDNVSYFSIKSEITSNINSHRQSLTTSTSTTVNNNNTATDSLASSTMISTSEYSISSSNFSSVPVPAIATTVGNNNNKRKSLSHRLSMAFLPQHANHSDPEKSLSYEEIKEKEEIEERQQQRAIQTMTRLIRQACDILGITYYQSSSTQLVCLLTLRNCKLKSSQDQRKELHQKVKDNNKKSKEKRRNYKKRLSRFLESKGDKDDNSLNDNDDEKEVNGSNMTTTFTTSSLLKSKLFNNKKYSNISNMSRTTTLTMMTTATMNSMTSGVEEHSSCTRSNRNSQLSKWWSKQLHRLSNPFYNDRGNSEHHISQPQHPSALSATTTTTSTSASTAMVLGDSTYHTKSLFSKASMHKKKKRDQEESILILQNNNADESNSFDSPDGFAIMTIDISCVSTSQNDHILALRYVKSKGSAKVFLLAKGWIQMILSQCHNNNNNNSSTCISKADKY